MGGFLTTSSPLGSRAREILDALRNGGRLPSDEFGTKLPPPRSAADIASGSSDRASLSVPDSSGGASSSTAKFVETTSPASDNTATAPGSDPWSETGGLNVADNWG